MDQLPQRTAFNKVSRYSKTFYSFSIFEQAQPATRLSLF